ncbi:uncharacterized protein LOC106013625, partial [Aplysia californica]|uniref:Uncharacterized protein LOC106013625 n=1 Tax=Aplysia californica TaxID=6500 RepID=A0ABM1ACY5_APLCA
MDHNSFPTACETPRLAEPTEETWMELMGDCVSMWLKNSPEFFKVAKQKLLRMAKCPFLFGVSDNLPRPWMEVLINYGILESGREKKTSPLREAEMEMFEMVEVIFERCLQLVENKVDLKTILNFINDVDERSGGGTTVDIAFALSEISKL